MFSKILFLQNFHPYPLEKQSMNKFNKFSCHLNPTSTLQCIERGKKSQRLLVNGVVGGGEGIKTFFKREFFMYVIQHQHCFICRPSDIPLNPRRMLGSSP
jgi:hypothetical protein